MENNNESKSTDVTSCVVLSETSLTADDSCEESSIIMTKNIHSSGPFIESQHKVDCKLEMVKENCKTPQTSIQEIILKLDQSEKDVAYFRNIITFDKEIKHSFPHRSDSETGRILQNLKSATFSAEEEAEELAEIQQETKATFHTSLSEEELEKSRQRHDRLRITQETSFWKDDPLKRRVSMQEVVENKTQQHYRRGVEETNKGCFEAAVTSFTKALNLDPSNVSCYVERGEAFLQLCDFRSAYLNYKKAHCFQPRNDHIYGKLSFICYIEGQSLFDQALYAEALECFTRAADLKSNVKAYHMRAITCLAALGRNQECLALVTRRLESEATSNPELYVLRARLHQQFGNTTLSYYDVKEALSLDADQPQARDMMNAIREKAALAKEQAINYSVQGKLNEAFTKISTAIQVDPSMADYHVLRGALLRRMKNFSASIDDYLLAMDKSDHNESNQTYFAAQRQLLLTYNDFAVHCYHKGFYDESLFLLNKAIKEEKEEKGLYVNRGDCFFKLNNLGFALADYEQALELDPGCWAIKCRLSVVQNEYGIAAYQERSYLESVQYFTSAINYNNKVGQFYVHRSRAHYMLENVEKAREDVLVALHLDPDNDEMLHLISRLFPGRSVSEVLQSKAADVVRKQLSSTVTTHPKLPYLSRLPSTSLGVTINPENSPLKCMSSNLSKTPSTATTNPGNSNLTVPSSELALFVKNSPEYRHLPSDKEIVEAKRKINKELKQIFDFPIRIKSMQPKILSSLSGEFHHSCEPDSNASNFTRWM